MPIIQFANRTKNKMSVEITSLHFKIAISVIATMFIEHGAQARVHHHVQSVPVAANRGAPPRLTSTSNIVFRGNCNQVEDKFLNSGTEVFNSSAQFPNGQPTGTFKLEVALYKDSKDPNSQKKSLLLFNFAPAQFGPVARLDENTCRARTDGAKVSYPPGKNAFEARVLPGLFRYNESVFESKPVFFNPSRGEINPGEAKQKNDLSAGSHQFRFGNSYMFHGTKKVMCNEAVVISTDLLLTDDPAHEVHIINPCLNRTGLCIDHLKTTHQAVPADKVVFNHTTTVCYAEPGSQRSVQAFRELVESMSRQ